MKFLDENLGARFSFLDDKIVAYKENEFLRIYDKE